MPGTIDAIDAGQDLVHTQAGVQWAMAHDLGPAIRTVDIVSFPAVGLASVAIR